LPVQDDDRILIDYRTSDDAGVYRLEGDRALVQTVDFFTPIVDDPFTYGRIAAANALSDIYAMGARPLTALAIAAFPDEIERGTIKAIFAGGLATLSEARVALLGGHTIQDPEIKFGYAVTGEMHPDRVLANAGAREGDALVLTKPLGTGVIATALKFGRAPDAAIRAAVASMITLNRAASEALKVLPPDAVHACTDITGFGLVGHATEMAVASGCTIEIDAASVPLLDGARDLGYGNIPGGGRANARHFPASLVRQLDDELVQLLYDPQTSGGLLAAIDGSQAGAACAALEAAGAGAFRVGTVRPYTGARILLG
jgi:selenide,water dikinase